MMKSQDPVNSAEQKSVWPDDWFIFDNGKINGPMTAEQAFSTNDQSTSDSRLVSRKGFTQWYPLRDFVHLYKYSAAPKDLISKASQNTVPKVEANFVGPSPTMEEVTATPSINIESKPRDPNLSLAHYLPERAVRIEKANVLESKKSETQKTPVSIEPTSIEQEYLTSKGRIRLGGIRNSFLTAFVYGLFSLGIYHAFWFRRAMYEVSYHLDGSQKRPSFIFTIFTVLPFIQVIPFYILSRRILEMESQNNLKSTAAPWTVLFSLIPFGGVFYLQRQMNRHWLAHAKHAFAARKNNQK